MPPCKFGTIDRTGHILTKHFYYFKALKYVNRRILCLLPEKSIEASILRIARSGRSSVGKSERLDLWETVYHLCVWKR